MAVSFFGLTSLSFDRRVLESVKSLRINVGEEISLWGWWSWYKMIANLVLPVLNSPLIVLHIDKNLSAILIFYSSV